MTPDNSASIMTEYLIDNLPFFYLRYGDGALECINKLGAGKTCDGEVYSDELAKALLQGWDIAMKGKNVFIGDWLSTSFDYGQNTSNSYTEEYRQLIGQNRLNMLHFDALTLRQSDVLLNFYYALKHSKRRKLYLGPGSHKDVTSLLNVEHYPVPIVHNLFNRIDLLTGVLKSSTCDIILFAAGMAGAIAALRCFKEFPNKTYIHLGSALDPLYRGRTRGHQLSPKDAKELFTKLV